MSLELQKYGLVPFFAQQLTIDEMEHHVLARVTEVQRSLITVTDGLQEYAVPLTGHWHESAPKDRPTVGDWILIDNQYSKVERVLERKSVFQRVAAGGKTEIQTIAANIDILFIVTSCNEEFSESRLERYLALAAEAVVTPVVVLTKIDLSDEPEEYATRARSVQPGLPVETINSLDRTTLKGVTAWIDTGCTIALVGSSGVGKSTLLNALLGSEIAVTGGIREQDRKGRHTTSFRSLYLLPDGGLLIDVPGIRELKVAEIGTAIESVFEDIESLASQCRFANCEHGSEPYCAVRLAIENGEIDERRWQNYLKLRRESERNSSSLAEQRTKGRDFAKVVKQAKAMKNKLVSKD